MNINVYERYYEAEGTFNGRERHAALVMLISDSAEGNITYEAAVTFFPHDDEEDFGVSYDAYFAKTLYSGKGRRSKKREALLLEGLQTVIDDLASENGAAVFWDRPLRDARTA
ncbi:MAG: hypothetical protein IKF05_00455 [Erysipelotrichaceae bacterium]|nr:hypothetical protein [Erysipelotrichaceae bacterium]